MEESIKKQVLKIIELVELNGIVTRDDVASIDNRGFIRSFPKYLEELKIDSDKFMTAETFLPEFRDYSGVIYDPEEYTTKEACDYVIKNVLYYD